MDADQITSQRGVWDSWAKADPLWAILAREGKQRGRWDAEEFFATGRREIAGLVRELAEQGMQVETGRCLDFGCGVGRLSQALAGSFDHVDGVDISETMVELATGFNQHGERCAYHVNVAEDLSLFDEGTFDLIYSNIVLQHNQPEVARGYMAEFVRILKPGGLAVFDMPDSLVPSLPDGSHHASIELLTSAPELIAATKSTLRVRVTNSSAHDWPAGKTLRLGNHWRGPRGKMIVRDDGAVGVPAGLARGASAQVTLEVTAPARPGSYRLQLDLVEPQVTWFARRGSPRTVIDVVVSPPRLWRLRRLVAGVRRRVARPSANAPTAAPARPAPWSMNVLPRALVEQTVTEGGAEVVATRHSGSAGPRFVTYRYYVRKTGPA